MLILNRKQGERIVIGNQVTMTVLESRSGRVKLGFSGPAEVPIHREEVHGQVRGNSPNLRRSQAAGLLACVETA